MSRLDVLKSLLRSTALAAADGVRKHRATTAIGELLEQATLMRTRIDDGALTAAVARTPGVTAATVRARNGQLRIDASFDDNREPLRIALWPASFSFAPMGAKEVAFGIEPSSAISDPRAADVCGTLAAEIAHAAWRAVLGPVRPSDGGALMSREGAFLVADLRSVPAVRRNRDRKLALGVIEALKPAKIEVVDGELRITMTLEALR